MIARYDNKELTITCILLKYYVMYFGPVAFVYQIIILEIL